MKTSSTSLLLLICAFTLTLAYPSNFSPNHASLQKRCPPFDPAGVKNIGNAAGTQFIGGQCLSNTDCASACCALPCGICSGLGAQFQAGKAGCGFGGGASGSGKAAAVNTGTGTSTGTAGTGGNANVGTNINTVPATATTSGVARAGEIVPDTGSRRVENGSGNRNSCDGN